jgi:hypothetical protein
MACSATTTCYSGACVTPCAAGQLRCGGACTFIATDPMNCNACGHACLSGQVCNAGVCSNIITGYRSGPLPASVVWVDACGAAGAVTTLSLIDDGMGMTYTLPFTFTFFENMYTQITPSADGYIGFGATGTSWGSYGSFMLPGSFVPQPVFFAYSRDLYQRSGGECFAVIGTAPNRSVVWETNDAYNYFDSSTHLTFEAFLNETSNTIDVIYQTLTGTGTDGSTSSVGMINASGSHYYQYEYNAAGTLSSGLRVRFSPM